MTNSRLQVLEKKSVVTEDDVLWALDPMTGPPLMITDGRNKNDAVQRQLWSEYWRVMERLGALVKDKNIALTKEIEISVVEIQMDNGK